jgi:hypothetical protein
LQIMMAAAGNIDLRSHRGQRPIETGQLRVLKRTAPGGSRRTT